VFSSWFAAYRDQESCPVSLLHFSLRAASTATVAAMHLPQSGLWLALIARCWIMNVHDGIAFVDVHWSKIVVFMNTFTLKSHRERSCCDKSIVVH
jgi:hypothetical protein